MSPDEPAVLYIATSRQLAEWAARHRQSYPFKIGTARTAEGREWTLALGYRGGPNCLGCKDWSVRPADVWPFATRRRAEAAERLFKRYVRYLAQPVRADLDWHYEDGTNGESDVYMVHERELESFGASDLVRDRLLGEVLRRARWRMKQLRDELHPERDPDEFECVDFARDDGSDDPD